VLEPSIELEANSSVPDRKIRFAIQESRETLCPFACALAGWEYWNFQAECPSYGSIAHTSFSPSFRMADPLQVHPSEPL